MAAALVIMSYHEYGMREANALATKILTQAKDKAEKGLKSCMKKNNAETIETCQRTLAGQAASTCSEIMGRLATELPQTFEICQNMYKNSLNAGVRSINNL